MTRDTTSSTRKMKKMIFAIPAAAPATPPKPRAAAISAITRKVKAQPSIAILLSMLVLGWINAWARGGFPKYKLSVQRSGPRRQSGPNGDFD
jgi:hypothetical protein